MCSGVAKSGSPWASEISSGPGRTVGRSDRRWRSRTMRDGVKLVVMWLQSLAEFPPPTRGRRAPQGPEGGSLKQRSPPPTRGRRAPQGAEGGRRAPQGPEGGSLKQKSLPPRGGGGPPRARRGGR